MTKIYHYAVRGYELWGFKAPEALSFQPFKFVDIYGIQKDGFIFLKKLLKKDIVI